MKIINCLILSLALASVGHAQESAAAVASPVTLQSELETRLQHMREIQDLIGLQETGPAGALSALGQLITLGEESLQEALISKQPEALTEARAQIVELEEEAVRISKLPKEMDDAN